MDTAAHGEHGSRRNAVMFKGLTRGLGRLFSCRVLTVLRRDVSSGDYVEDKDYAVYLKSRKAGRKD